MKSEMKTSWNRVGIFIGTKHLGLSLGYETKRLENRDETLLYETPRDHHKDNCPKMWNVRYDITHI